LRNYDAISAYEVGNAELEDAEQFDFAIRQGRAIVTHNAHDFEPLVDQYYAQGKEHFGLIIAEQLPIGELLRRLLRLLNTVSADEMKNSYRDLGEFK
jgi:predicted nuclease of predicted toxin-antitoxin system